MSFQEARLNMVESQVRPNGVTDARVLEAMGHVRREDFVPAQRRKLAYLEGQIQLDASDGNRVLVQPMALGRMLQMAAIKSSGNVLMVGAGPGYGTVIVAGMARQVTALEEDAGLAGELRAHAGSLTNVSIVQGAHAAGYAQAAPYDVILIEGRVREVPETLLSQLAHGGRLVCGVGERDACALVVVTNDDGHRTQRPVFDVSLSALSGFPVQRPEFVF
jgi:protein-L-isoaspartate(D-aspartate) O-methyltransferase